jgi:hypothetical protein
VHCGTAVGVSAEVGVGLGVGDAGPREPSPPVIISASNRAAIGDKVPIDMAKP